MKRLSAAALLLVVATATWLHAITATPLLFEKFDAGWEDRWQHSGSDKYGGEFEVDTPKGLDDPALKVPTKAQFYGISGLLSKPINPADGLALQFELKLSEDAFGCGGAYLKFLTADAKFVPKDLKDDSPYTVMFGPDKCGATNKVHLIFRHKNPKTGTIEEKHLKAPPIMAAGTETHVYTAIVKPDNTYAILIDGEESKAGSLFEDFEPPFLPPKEIPDPKDSKPSDWVDEAKIPDPDASKPDDWDEDAPRTIPDEDAVKPDGWLDDEPTEVPDASVVKPDDWDDEEDGEWEPPLVSNPKCATAPGCGEWQRPTKANPDYKGKWTPPLIDNPKYKGPWKPRDIPNPEFHEDKEPLKHIGNVGAAAVEIWTMEEGYFFDNIVVAATEDEVATIRETYWQPKHEVEVAALAKKAAEETKAAASQLLHSRIVATLRGAVASLPLPEPYADKVGDALAFLDATPAAVYAVVGTPLVLVLVLVLRLVAGGSKPDAVAVAKKTDAPVPDDAAPATNGASTARGEIEADDDEDTGVRRRTRREQ